MPADRPPNPSCSAPTRRRPRRDTALHAGRTPPQRAVCQTRPLSASSSMPSPVSSHPRPAEECTHSEARQTALLGDHPRVRERLEAVRSQEERVGDDRHLEALRPEVRPARADPARISRAAPLRNSPRSRSARSGPAAMATQPSTLRRRSAWRRARENTTCGHHDLLHCSSPWKTKVQVRDWFARIAMRPPPRASSRPAP